MGKTLTHGSLFAGVGGFEIAAREAGMKTLWNCEIECYPRLVLKARFPDVTQYGDIRKLNGGEVEPVSIITFGSPCQSFSQAGARQGLDGASGLFYEAVRVIREMREATAGRQPRYAIMENVPRIYSSKSQGKSDFREVLNELLKIVDETVDVPLPKDGKFLAAGAIVGDGYSLAYRTLCASQFGVAQRRRRMFLVVDFAGERAAEILSEPEGKGRHFTPGYFEGQGSAGSAEAGASGIGITKCYTFEPGACSRLGGHVWDGGPVGALRADMGDNQTSVVYDARGNGNGETANTITGDHENRVTDYTALCVTHEKAAPAIQGQDGVNPAHMGDNQAAAYTYPEPRTMKVRCGCAGGGKGALIQSDMSGTLSCNNEQTLFEPYNICSMESNSMKSSNAESGIYTAETSRTLDSNAGSPGCRQGGTVIAIQGNVLGRSEGNGPGGIGFREDAAYAVNTVDKGGAVCYQETVGALYASDFKGIRNQDIGKDKAVVENRYAVRRLTPLECLRLQGLPDGHLDNIHIIAPTDVQLEYWRSAWAELGKKKTGNQLRKWLANPYSDSHAYKAIGNSLAVPCALWVLRGVVEHSDK